MSTCCSIYREVAGAHFNDVMARRDLASYRKKGPGPTTRLLRDLLVQAQRVEGTLLDVGSGIGALTFELLERGIGHAIAVDASPAYLAVATEEAVRRGRAEAVAFREGDFLEIASSIPPATAVTLDRVICCYPSYEALLEESLRHAECCFAFSYPGDVWYVRGVLAVENGRRRLRRNPFRTFVHPADRMAEVIERAGFRLAARRQTWFWSADVYVRAGF